MPETYKNSVTIHGTTASTTIYSGSSGTAIVNSINISNVSSAGGTTVTVNLVKGSTSYSLITNGVVPLASSLQVLDSPIVLQTNDFLTATAGNTGFLHTIVSLLEIT
jgi:hypothetical protein